MPTPVPKPSRKRGKPDLEAAMAEIEAQEPTPPAPSVMTLDPGDDRLKQRELKTSSIVRGDNHRTSRDDDKQKELNASIKALGILSPILVRPLDDGSYSIIAGFRRFEGAIANKLETVPVIVLNSNDQMAYIQSLVENVQREDISDLDEATGYQRLLDTPGPDGKKMTQAELAKLVGKSQPYISNQLRLLKLPDAIQAKVRSGELAPSAAKAIVSLPPEAQKRVANDAVKRNYTATQVEREASYERQRAEREAADKKAFEADVLALVELIEEAKHEKVIRKKTVIKVDSQRYIEPLLKKGYEVEATTAQDTTKNGFTCDDDAVVISVYSKAVKPLCTNREHPEKHAQEERAAREAEWNRQVSTVNEARKAILASMVTDDGLTTEGMRFTLYTLLSQPWVTYQGGYSTLPIRDFWNRHNKARDVMSGPEVFHGLWAFISQMTAAEVAQELIGIGVIAAFPNVYADNARWSNELHSQVRQALVEAHKLDESLVWGGHDPVERDDDGYDTTADSPHKYEAPDPEFIAEFMAEGEEIDESEFPCQVEGCELPQSDPIHNVIPEGQTVLTVVGDDDDAATPVVVESTAEPGGEVVEDEALLPA